MQQPDKRDITLYGAGGHCKVVLDILESTGENVGLIVDDGPVPEFIKSIPTGQPDTDYGRVIITIGNCLVRKKISERITVKEYPVAIHPSAIIAKDVTIGEGSVIAQGSVVQTDAVIGRHCIVNTNASVDHDSVLGDYVHVASGATICGGVDVGECTWIGAGAVVRQGIRIGRNCMIGAGSVVVSDIPDNVTAFGNPCRIRTK